MEGLESGEIDLEAAISLAHVEDVEAWASEIAGYFAVAEVETVSLQVLQQSIDLPWIEVWLGLLLGSYRLERRGDDFYAGDIWVHNRLPALIDLQL